MAERGQRKSWEKSARGSVGQREEGETRRGSEKTLWIQDRSQRRAVQRNAGQEGERGEKKGQRRKEKNSGRKTFEVFKDQRIILL